ncbi:MAG TPA: hypothetical protein PK228_14930 [Saprospiraceae bacterium]|nr:hypothetical protein [Saprospiraceae bacterium]
MHFTYPYILLSAGILIVVIVSMLVQGTTVAAVARAAGVEKK